MDSPLLKATSTGSGTQLPVPSGPVTAKVLIARHGGCGSFCPVTEASWTEHFSLLNSASTGPGALAPRLHLPHPTGLGVTAHAQWGRNAGQELAVKWPQVPVVPAVHALNLAYLEAPTAVSGALAPVSHFPASTGTEVASLCRVRSLDGRAVGIHLGAALHPSPVGPQTTCGGALAPVSDDPVCRAVVICELLVIGGIQQKALGNQTCCILLSQDGFSTFCLIHVVWKFQMAMVCCLS